jgi:hypothetical protein
MESNIDGAPSVQMSGANAAFVSRLPQTRHNEIGQLESPAHIESTDEQLSF